MSGLWCEAGAEALQEQPGGPLFSGKSQWLPSCLSAPPFRALTCPLAAQGPGPGLCFLSSPSPPHPDCPGLCPALSGPVCEETGWEIGLIHKAVMVAGDLYSFPVLR